LTGQLQKAGFNFFCGVPCSYIGPFCETLPSDDPSLHIQAVREDVAVGIAAGAYLSGKKPVIYMQNGGLGYSLETFASLLLIYRIPSLILITYRGPDDDQMEEHRVMGEHTEQLLKEFSIDYSILDQDLTKLNLQTINRHLNEKQLPYCLLIGKGVIK